MKCEPAVSSQLHTAEDATNPTRCTQVKRCVMNNDDWIFQSVLLMNTPIISADYKILPKNLLVIIGNEN